MGTITRPPLGDPEVYPSADVLTALLGPAWDAYTTLFAFLEARYPDVSATWAFYRDGGRWLLRATRGKTTVFWLAADAGSFRTTFYLSTAYESAVRDSDLPLAIKEEYSATAGKRFRGLTVTVRTTDDLDPCRMLIRVKLGEPSG